MAEVSAGKLVARLAGGKPVPAIVLIGSDVSLGYLCRRQIIEECIPEGARDWAVARIRGDAAGWDEALERVQTMPMLAPRQVIIVEDAQLIEKLGDDSRDEIIKALTAYLDSPAPFSVLLIEAAALDGRQKLRKLLAEKALLVELTIGPESASALAVQMAKELKIDIDLAAASLLAESLNFEPARIHMEIDKLAAYAFDRGRITTADAEDLVKAARKNTVWQLADMLASKQRARALQFLDNMLREGEEPVRLVGALAFRYHKLVEARGVARTTRGSHR